MSDLRLLTDAAYAAGEIAQSFWKKSPKTWNKDDNAGPVTEADLAVNTMLAEGLMAARPGFGWLSEETVDTADRQNTENVFIIDPIDGTRSFIAGETTWSHSLAIARNGVVVAAVVYLPVTAKMYAAQLGGGATLNGVPIAASGRTDIAGATVLSARPNFDAIHWKSTVPPVKRHFRTSLAYRMALVAEGRFDAMLTLRDTWEWDVAAGTLIATEAGAVVTDRHGQIPRFNNLTPKLSGLVAGTTKIQSNLQSELL